MYDGNGNVGQMIDCDDGQLAASYEYDPFGNLINSAGGYAAVNPFRFSTKYFDEETELYYYGYRFYVPELGRWLSSDPIEEDGGVNLLAFVQNNPIILIDPYGLISAEELVAIPKVISRIGTMRSKGKYKPVFPNAEHAGVFYQNETDKNDVIFEYKLAEQVGGGYQLDAPLKKKIGDKCYKRLSFIHVHENEKYIKVSFPDYITTNKPMIIVATEGYDAAVAISGSNYEHFTIY